MPEAGLPSDEFTISADKTRLNIALIHEYLSQRSYWAQGRALEVVRKSIEQSLYFGLYRGDEQVGFARVVTDGATFAWLCDVFVLETMRGRGLGLTSMNERLKAVGGHLSIHSQVGDGTTIHAVAPLSLPTDTSGEVG